MFQGVIFDVEGTLVDSNDAHARAWVEALAEAGHQVPFERVPYDMEAALRARVAIIGFRSGGWTERDLEGSLAVYDGPADLLARLESSPLRRAA